MAMPSTPASITTSAILSRLITPDDDRLSRDAAEGLLRIQFRQSDLDRMHELAEKNQEDELHPEERAEMENYRQVGYLLGMIHSRARQALRSV